MARLFVTNERNNNNLEHPKKPNKQQGRYPVARKKQITTPVTILWGSF
jgi:hypothetical protein